MTGTPGPPDDVVVAYTTDGHRVIAFLDPALTDSPLRRVLPDTAPSAAGAQQTPAPASSTPRS
ncbi:hypothetical protein [Streptomyces ipomoeae]|uniref:hypothetical protein n=1 Tax=Streptomyces ipomoeae TaxID=103232 RepID=UPI00114787EC|nr:hypothetical protein [Streptomyces ipomoeae]TQE33029.1 hypothetical protein Sipo7851_21220 [Streptomyces ipomoeae]